MQLLESANLHFKKVGDVSSGNSLLKVLL
jgi:hypothetical protein